MWIVFAGCIPSIIHDHIFAWEVFVDDGSCERVTREDPESGQNHRMGQYRLYRSEFLGSIEMSNRDSTLQSRCLMNQFIGRLHCYLELHNRIRSPCLELGVVTYDRHRIYEAFYFCPGRIHTSLIYQTSKSCVSITVQWIRQTTPYHITSRLL